MTVANKKPMTPEKIMSIIALCCGALVLVMLVLSIPYMNQEEDPLPLRGQEPTMAAAEAEMEQEEIMETEPKLPTIPPEKNPYGPYDFQYNRHNYLLLQNLPSSAGVDVSAWQGDIDWEQVAASGIEFAMIRLGYRGYEEGKLNEDKYAQKNLTRAKDAGLKVGAYFFSQALSIEEADQEIAFMLKILGEHYLAMPIVLDWEIPSEKARTYRNMDARTLTDIQRHFCQVMTEKGYTPMVYFNTHQSENLYYLSELEDYPFWLALYQERMDFPWAVEMWQYTSEGIVPGIDGPVDLNVYMPN